MGWTIEPMSRGGLWGIADPGLSGVTVGKFSDTCSDIFFKTEVDLKISNVVYIFLLGIIFNFLLFNPCATGDAYMRQLFHCLQ